MLPSHPIKAIVWDFDGTLADTRQRNLAVNRRIVEEMTGRSWREVAALSSVEAYVAAWMRVSNWQELYTTALGLRPEQCQAAAQRWAPVQLDDPTPVPLLPGAREALHDLRDFPQAVVSQNDRAIIVRTLEDNSVARYFTAVIGYAEVPMDRQKPAPDGLLRALDILGIEEPATALYVGDHESDLVCAKNANRDLLALGHELWFRTVAVDGDGAADPSAWSMAADHRISGPRDVPQLVREIRTSHHNG